MTSSQHRVQYYTDESKSEMHVELNIIEMSDKRLSFSSGLKCSAEVLLSLLCC